MPRIGSSGDEAARHVKQNAGPVFKFALEAQPHRIPLAS